jgi:hypothetical protein
MFTNFFFTLCSYLSDTSSHGILRKGPNRFRTISKRRIIMQLPPTPRHQNPS